jgi:hypothetical protein
MNAFELYQQLGKKFEEDPTTKELPVCVNDGEWGEMESTILEFRPKSIVDGKPRNIVLLDW